MLWTYLCPSILEDHIGADKSRAGLFLAWLSEQGMNDSPNFVLNFFTLRQRLEEERAVYQN